MRKEAQGRAGMISGGSGCGGDMMGWVGGARQN